MRINLTSPIPVCNIFYHEEPRAFHLSDVESFPCVVKLWGYDIKKNDLVTEDVVIIEDAAVRSPRFYFRERYGLERDMCLLPETLVLNAGKPCKLNELDLATQVVAGVLQEEAAYFDCYTKGQLFLSDAGWCRSDRVAKLTTVDFLLSERVQPAHDDELISCVRLLCPDGFYPWMFGNLILGTHYFRNIMDV